MSPDHDLDDGVDGVRVGDAHPFDHAVTRPPARRTDGGFGALLPFLWLLSLVLAFGGGLMVERLLLDRAPASGGPLAAVPTPMPTSTAPDATRPAETSAPSASSASSGPAATPTTGGSPASPDATSEPTPRASAGPSAEPSGTARPTPSGPPATQPPDAPADFGLFWEAYRTIKDRYVDQAALAEPNITYGAIRGMVDALRDTGHSTFLTPEDLDAEQQSLQGVLIGIGVVLDPEAPVPTIMTVISGGPADRAGVRPGDQLVKIDDREVASLPSTEIVKLVRGDEGSTVRVTVLHEGETTPVEVSIVRERIVIPAVVSGIVPGTDILHIRVVQFSTGAADEFHRQLRAGIDGGAKRVVLDVRNDPGGYVNEAIAIASEFVREGNVYLSQNAQGDRTPAPVVAGGLALELPVVVLVDKGTASSAEIVAGAIQDAGRGPVIGVTTFGTGTLLNVFPLSDGSAVRLGVEQWLTPDGREIWRRGIVPDEVVELPAGAVAIEPNELEGTTLDQLIAGTDTQLARALRILTDR